MKLWHYIVFAAIVLAGLVGSLFLVARTPELALMSLRDKDFDDALSQYETRLAAGDSSMETVIPLGQIYLEFGRVEEAVDLMERFVKEHPANTAARRLLATYYKQSQRPKQYLEALEQIAKEDPSEATLRDLAENYGFAGDYQRQVQVLQDLVRRYQVSARDLLQLAALEAVQGQFKAAAATLDRFEAEHPEAVTLDTVQFLVGLLLDSSESERAARRAQAWLVRRPDAEMAVQFASLFLLKGAPKRALTILEPFSLQAEGNERVLRELTQLEVENQQQGRALERLDRLYAAKRMPGSLTSSYLDLLMSKGEAARALDVAAAGDLTGLPAPLLASLVDAALATGQQDFINDLTRRLGDDFLNDQPLVGARVAIARGDRAAAVALLSPLALEADTPDSVLSNLAYLYLDTNRAAEGLKLLDPIRERSPAVEESWALLGAKAGPEAPVVDWLRRNANRPVRPEILQDVYFLASGAGKKTAALVAAEQLYQGRRLSQDRLRLATALLGAGRPADAVPHLRALRSELPDVEPLYAEALTQAVQKGAPLQEELARFWTGALSATGLSAARQQELAYALLSIHAYEQVLPTLKDLARRLGDAWVFAYVDAALKSEHTAEVVDFLKSEIGRADLPQKDKAVRVQLLRERAGDEIALPYMRQMAETIGADWSFAYEEALQKLGRTASLAEYWKTRAARADLPVAERRGIGFKSLESGQRRLGEDIFMALAEQAPPDSPDVAELLYLWGPRPQPANLDWLESRARSATGARKAAWMQHLMNAGAYRRVVAVGGDTDDSEVYLQALVQTGDGPRLSAAIERQYARTSDLATLRRLGRVALQLNRQATARSVFAKVLSVAPDDPEAHLRLGFFDYAEGKHAAAVRHFQRHLAQEKGDPETHFLFGEALANSGEPAKALPHYREALTGIDQQRNRSHQLRVIRALTLQRLGRIDDAVAEFEALLKEQPQNKSLRADYAAMLLQSGRNDEGRRVLALR